MATVGLVVILIGAALVGLAIVVFKKRASITGAVNKAAGQADAVAKQVDALKK